MSVVKLTFDGSLNTAKQDAEFNYYLTNNQNGIIKGLKDEVKATISNGKITFKSGYVSIYGRRVFIENGTSITITQDSTKYGYVILEYSTLKNDVTLKLKEGTSSSYPALINTNLINEDGIYEFPILGYFKTTSSVTIYESCRKFVTTRNDDISEAKVEINEKIDSLVHGLRSRGFSYPTTQGKMIRFNLDNDVIMSNGIIFFGGYGFYGSVSIVQLRNTTTIPFYYNLDGKSSLILIERTGNDVVFTMPDTNTKIKDIYVVY